MTIEQVRENKKQYMDLLFLADEQEEMIDKYLDEGEMFVLKDPDVVGECVVVDLGNGEFEIIKDKHGFVIGGMEGSKYTEYELKLEPGSKLFLYTDGLPEATSEEDTMFGMDRIVESLKKVSDGTPEEILKSVRKDVDVFVKEAEQFDDLTMLCLEYKGVN